MTDYAAQLFGMISGVGDSYAEGRKQRTTEINQNRNYAAMLDELDWRKKTDQRNYDRQLSRDAVGDSQWQQSFGLQGAQLGLSRDRLAFERQNAGLPQGYLRNPDGTMSFVPGGPADPVQARALTEATNEGKPPRPLPNATLNDLGGKGAAVTDLDRLTGGFKDNYGGSWAGWIGDAQNAVGRNVGLGYGDQAQWWQDYQGRKNVVRNNLFGSALTAQEKAEFEKADINPGMSAETIRANLARQQQLAYTAARKIASAYTLQGFSPDVIEAAIGIPLSELGVDVQPSGNEGAGSQQQQPLKWLRNGGMPASPAAQQQLDQRNGTGGTVQSGPNRSAIEAEMRRRGMIP